MSRFIHLKCLVINSQMAIIKCIYYAQNLTNHLKISPIINQ